MPCFSDLDGIFANGIHAGIKANGSKDLGFIWMPDAVGSAGVFTQNQFVASSVVFTKHNLSKNVLKAVIVNSGNANAGTGRIGEEATCQMASVLATALGISAQEVAVAATGKIGEIFPFEIVKQGIDDLMKNPFVKNGHAVAEAILTTDLCTKTVYKEAVIGGKTIVISGITKGSGMIAPHMATTLTFLVTNAHILSDPLQTYLGESIENSYNMVSIDTDTSTNDMALLFSIGKKSTAFTTKQEWDAFGQLLTDACIDLAKQIAKDGEGATKLIEVFVEGVVCRDMAKKIALNVVNSPLVKTAIHGADPNWGRILAAACRDTQYPIDVNKIELKIGDQQVFFHGTPVLFDKELVIKMLKKEEVYISLNLHDGNASVTAWGCDLTKGYVDINTSYC